MAVAASERLVHAASLADVRAAGRLVVHVDRHTLCLFAEGDGVYAVDNRCPHMGFPLHRGSVSDGILTCHWHHARFDLCTGGTFDQFADDLRTFPVELRHGEVWVDVSPRTDVLDHQRKRLSDGLERNITLVIAKAVIALLDGGVEASEPYRIGLDFGVRYRRGGGGPGPTLPTCQGHPLPHPFAQHPIGARYPGVSAGAVDS